MTTDLYEKIITDRLVFGKPVKQVATEIGKNDWSVTQTVNAFNAVKDRDWNRCVALIKMGIPEGLFNWASQRLSIELPPLIGAAFEEKKRENIKIVAERKAKKSGAEPPATEPPAAPSPQPQKPDNAALFLVKILEALEQQNELLCQLMDVVIPKYVSDVKDNVNANCDTLFNQLKETSDTVEVIKNNTRKRGL